MAKNLLNKYVWLVETIYKAKKITYEEINQRWLDNDLSEGNSLPLRTFHKWRIAIEEMFGLIIENEQSGRYRYYIENADELMFGLIIENEQSGRYRYYIENADELRSGSMRSWLFNTLTVSNLMLDSVSIKDKVLFEEIPDGEQYLPDILEALKKNLVLGMTYQSFTRDEANSFEIEPYCLKAFKQRWYLVARSPYYNKIMIYALDRVQWLGLTEKSFKYPKNFIPEEFFDDCFGIIADQNVNIETVKFKVSAGQANYLRSLRLHQSQHEIERTDEYSVFTVRLRPTFDFRQEILSQGSDIEVLEPKWFRDEVAEICKHMWKWFRDEVAEICKHMWNKYKED